MGTTYTGKKIKDTYKSLIKVTDNTEAGTSGKQLSDGNGNDFGVYVDTDGVLGIGSAASVSLDVSAKNDAILLPNGNNTSHKPSGQTGMVRYNTTNAKFEIYDGAWKNIFTESGGTIDGNVTVTGDLTVQGSSTTISSETVTFEDNILLINKADAADTPFNTTSAGIEIEKAGTNPSFIHTFSNTFWTLSDKLNVQYGVYLDDNIRLHLGSSNDLQIRHSVHGYVENFTEHFYIKNHANGYDIRFHSDNGSGGDTEYYRLDGANVKNVFSKQVDINADLAVDTDSLFVDSTNNRVGFGTTTPDHQLQVENTGNAEIQAQRVNGAGVLIQAQSAVGVIGTNTNHRLDLKTNGSTRATILGSGNFGINTTNPAQDFVVADSTNGNGIELVAGGTTTIQSYHRGNSAYLALNVDTNETRLRSIGDTIFYNGSGFTEAGRVESDGTFKVINTLEFGSLKDTAEDITITKFVDEADTIASNKNDTTIPTSAAVDDHIKTKRVDSYKVIGLGMDYMSRVSDDGGVVDGMEKVMRNTEKLILA